MSADTAVRPSFAREALELLDKGQAEPALHLAAEGVRTYPTYLGGYIALADAYAALGYADDAKVILNEAKRKFPMNFVVELRSQTLLSNSVVELRSPTTLSNSVEELRSPTALNSEARQQSSTTKLDGEARQRSSTTKFDSEARQRSSTTLRLVNLAPPPSDDRIIRSASMRLIPGLEYTTLRFEGVKTRGSRSIQFLPDPPAFREFHKPGRSVFGPPPIQQPRKVSLEELADKIGRVRLTAEELEKRPPAPDPLQEVRHSVVTETLARIYMQQQSYDKAIDAFERLREQHPDQADKFDALIAECVKLRSQQAP
jgi:tetratricopeptide (TPR) repeat protein